MKKLFNSIALFAMVVVFAACNTEVPVESIKISDSKLVIRVDSTYQLKVEMVPESKTAVVNWTSSDEAVATVADGLVTGVAVGQAVITANVGNAVATCQVEVRQSLASFSFELVASEPDSLAIALTSSVENGYYWIGLTEKSVIDQYTDEQVIEACVSVATNTATQNNVTLKRVLDAYGYTGSKTWLVNHLNAGTDYVFYVVAVNPETGEWGTELYKFNVSTKALQKSQMTFTFNLDDKDLTITPSVNDEAYAFQYIADTALVKNYEGDAKQYMDYAKQYYDNYYSSYGGFYAILHKGTYSTTLSRLADGVDYVLICVGYRGGYTTDFITHKFTYTAPADENSDMGEGEENIETAPLRKIRPFAPSKVINMRAGDIKAAE